jgi:hypothetical protein
MENKNLNQILKEELLNQQKTYCKNFVLFNWIICTFPIIATIKNYSFLKSLLYDIIAGLTLAVIHVPQGMANGMLAGLGPMNGL